MGIQSSLLLIADIGGYTRFMKTHRINLAHAQDVVAQLLEAVIDGAKLPLKLAKLEGDAAFFAGSLPDGGLASVADYVISIRRAFLARQRLMEMDTVCTCDGCVGAARLKLKFVVHHGEVATQRVKKHVELAGVDVILVHRLLKNSVPLSEYVLMTPAVADHARPEIRSLAKPIDEDLEGLGKMTLQYIDLAELLHEAIPEPTPSFFRRWFGLLTRNVRSVPYLLKIKTPCEGFEGLGELPTTQPLLNAGSGAST